MGNCSLIISVNRACHEAHSATAVGHWLLQCPPHAKVASALGDIKESISLCTNDFGSQQWKCVNMIHIKKNMFRLTNSRSADCFPQRTIRKVWWVLRQLCPRSKFYFNWLMLFVLLNDPIELAFRWKELLYRAECTNTWILGLVAFNMFNAHLQTGTQPYVVAS